MNPLPSSPLVSVIIPTAAVPERAASLRRAIDSVASQATPAMPVEVVVVANGPGMSEAVLGELAADRRVRVETRAEGSAPAACRHGRAVAAGEFFSFLDDDDEYLPGAIAARVAVLRGDPTIDFVVSDGYAASGARLWSGLDVARLQADPLAGLVRTNWVASCGTLFRSARLKPDAFDRLPSVVEWTILAFELLASGARVGLVDAPTFRINDTPGSLSKARDFPLATVAAVERMIANPEAGRVRRALRHKLAAAMHEIAELELREGQRRLAWTWHVRSMFTSRSLRYAPFTRYLVLQLLSVGSLT